LAVEFCAEVAGAISSEGFLVAVNIRYTVSLLVLISITKLVNKAVIDRRLRPRCCHQASYFKCPKSSPVHSLACNWYYCAQFIAKPKAACALHFSWTAASSNLGL